MRTDPIRCEIAFNKGNGLISRAIAWVTSVEHPMKFWTWKRADLRGVPSHVRLIFVYEDGHREFYEALEGSSHGWSGPKPESWVQQWVREHRDRWTTRWDITDRLLDNGASVRELQRRCEVRKGVWDYDVGQLVSIYRYLRMGGRKPVRKPEGVVCSEAVVRIIDGEPGLCEHPLLPRGWHPGEPDMATPLSVYRAVLRLTVPGANIRNEVAGG